MGHLVRGQSVSTLHAECPKLRAACSTIAAFLCFFFLADRHEYRERPMTRVRRRWYVEDLGLYPDMFRI